MEATVVCGCVDRPCLEENEIVDLVTGNLDGDAAREAEAHIDACATCRVVLIELARVFELRASSLPRAHDDSTESSVDDAMPLLPAALMRGRTIGRYVVLEVLGAGAMGVVHAAFDPELDRKVALKLLRPRALGKGSSERLVREARAIAKLAHPNVVVVHDVGEHDGSVFMAMEYVDGGTLGEWLAEQTRTQPEIVRAFDEAGQGLQAAHAAGLVHRDFKPANVLRGRDGRARVTDFGLARQGSETGEDVLAQTDPGSGPRLQDATFTRTGALVGTPAYMSPEQFAGRVADARSDQFSFCVSLYEALCGARPFVGDTMAALAASVSAGQVRTSPAFEGLSKGMRAVLTRGLAVDPGSRFPSMAALLQALRTASSPRRWGGRLAVVGAMVLGAAGLASAQFSEPTATQEPRCAGDEASMQAWWTADRASAVEQALAGEGAQTGPRTRAAAVVRGTLDGYADAWTEERSAVCRADLSAQTEVAARCLDEGFVHFQALTRALETSDAAALRHASHAVAQLGDPAACGRGDWRSSSSIEPPPAQHDAVTQLRERFVAVQVEEQLGRYDDAHALSVALLEDARAVGFDPFTADVMVELALIRVERADYEGALKTLEEGFATALRGEHDEALAKAGALSLQIYAHSAPDPERAQTWQTITEAAVERAGPYTAVAGSYWHAAGLFARAQGRWDEAREALERALQVYAEVDPEGLEGSYALNSLAALEMDERKFEAAEEKARTLIARLTHLFGPDHPDLITVYSTLSAALSSQDRLDEASEAVERALALSEAWVDDEAVRVQGVRMNLAMLRKRQGKLVEARDLYAQTLATWVEERGADDSLVALAHNNLASTLAMMGATEEALQHHREALRIWAKVHGETHSQVALGSASVGADLTTLRRCDEARAPLERAHAITKSFEPTDVLVSVVEGNWAAYELHCTGDLEAAARWSRDAVAHGEQALDPHHPIVAKFLLDAADIAQRQGRHEQAGVWLARLSEDVDPEKNPAARARLLLVRARLADAAGDVEARRTDAKAGLAVLPEGRPALRDALQALL